MFPKWKRRTAFWRITPAKYRKHFVAVTAGRPEAAARCNQLVNDGNHQPFPCNSRFINLRAGIIPALGDSAQFAGTDVEHMNRSIW